MMFAYPSIASCNENYRKYEKGKSNEDYQLKNRIFDYKGKCYKGFIKSRIKESREEISWLDSVGCCYLALDKQLRLIDFLKFINGTEYHGMKKDLCYLNELRAKCNYDFHPNHVGNEGFVYKYGYDIYYENIRKFIEDNFPDFACQIQDSWNDYTVYVRRWEKNKDKRYFVPKDDYDKALLFCSHVLGMTKEKTFEEQDANIERLNQCVRYFIQTSHFIQAAELSDSLCKIVGQIGTERFDSLSVYSVLYNNAYSLIGINKINEANGVIRKMNSYYPLLRGTMIPEYYRLFSKYYDAICDYEKAYCFSKTAYDSAHVNKPTFPEEKVWYPDAEEFLYDLALEEKHLGYYGDAEVHLIQAYIQSGIKYGIGNSRSTKMLFPLVSIYYGLFAESLDSGNAKPEYIEKGLCLLNHLLLFLNKGYYDETMDYCMFANDFALLFSLFNNRKIMNILKEKHLQNIIDYIRCVDKDNANCSADYRYIYQRHEAWTGRTSDDFASLLFRDAIRQSLIDHGELSSQHRKVLQGCIWNDILTKDSLYTYHVNELYRLTREYLLRKIPFMRQSEQEISWYAESDVLNSIYQSAHRHHEDGLNGTLYDIALLKKNFLLNTRIDLAASILTEGNDKQRREYEDYMNLQKAIGLIEMKNDTSLRDSLLLTRRMINELEESLISSDIYKSHFERFNVSWKNVQSELSNNEIAIEFFTVPINNDSTLYTALTVEKGSPCPGYHELFTVSNTTNVFPNNHFLYQNIWGKLDNQLKGKRKVYFSPVDKLYGRNIEILPLLFGNDTTRQYYRLSSTRVLMETETPKSCNTAVVCGGIDYDCSDTVTDTFRIDIGEAACDGIARLESVPRALRSGFVFLANSKDEGEHINYILQSNGIFTTFLSGTEATESSFKSLNRKRTKYVHIATHGFYISYDDTISLKSDFPIYRHLFRGSYDSDYLLYRSGLTFSRCNGVTRGIFPPDGVDDGILFAKEIASMDLKGLDLLSLSACNTGLGFITGDGVYGLQRAFKIAGTKSVLMTLGEVDDNVCELLFARFYENLIIRKMTKVEALLKAQEYIMNIKGEDGENIYDDVSYITPFIIIDALE